MTGSQLLRVYNTVIGRHGLPAKAGSRKALRDMSVFGVWCEKHSVDPVAYIRARHDVIHWKWAIPIAKLPSKATLKWYVGRGEHSQYAALAQEHLQESVTDDLGLWSDELRPAGELMKRRLLDSPAACMLSMDVHGGWNPPSPWCRQCPVADQCRDKLPPTVAQRRIDVGRE